MSDTVRPCHFLSLDAFRTAYEAAVPGVSFCYATGDLALAAESELAARALRGLVQRYAQASEVALTQKARPDLPRVRGGRAFEYRATKCRRLTPC